MALCLQGKPIVQQQSQGSSQQTHAHSHKQTTFAWNNTRYKRRSPESTLLYKVVQENLRSFQDLCHEEGKHLPAHVTKEFEAFLKCGVLAHGFLRFRCVDCKHERLVAFSCKKRGFCGSCGARRMAETAAHLTDNVFPTSTIIRQWVREIVGSRAAAPNSPYKISRHPRSALQIQKTCGATNCRRKSRRRY